MFLITTADQRFWKTDEPIIFLGEWCKLFSQRHIWEQLSYEVLPYHWDDRKKLYEDYLYLDALYEKVLADLSEKLNKIHKEDNSIRYWRIILGPWLYYFIQIFYDRYLSIIHAIESGKVSDTIIEDHQNDRWIPINSNEFSTWYTGDEYNQFLYSIIIKRTNKLPYHFLQKPVSSRLYPYRSLNSKKHRHSSVFYKIVHLLKNDIPNKYNRIIFALHYLGRIDLLRLQLAYCQFPFFSFPDIAPGQFTINFELRNSMNFSKAENDFEHILGSIINNQIPIIYLESYKEMKALSLQSLPIRPKLIFNEVLFFSNDAFKFWAAHHVQKGAKLAGIQHGGNYGMGLWYSDEKHETSIYDAFFTWGWNNKDHKNVKPLTALKFNSIKRKKQYDKKGKILLVLAASPRFSYHMYSGFVASTGFLSYLNDQYRFVKLLSTKSKEALLVRLYRHDYGWSQLERWKHAFPEVECDEGNRSMLEQLNQCRLFIGTYNATTFLETFVVNFPSVLFWNPKHWELRESARSYFDLLRKAGILHDTPESAAQKVNEILEDPMSWWKQNEIQNAKDKFCNQFVRTSDRWLSELEKETTLLLNN
jgi:putative transferase (TIGR04331 family)